MSLRTRLLLWYSGVFAVSGALLVLLLYFLIAHKMRTDAQKFLNDEYEACARTTLELLDQPEMLEELIRREATKDRYYPLTYRLFDAEKGEERLFVMEPDYRGKFRAAIPVETAPEDNFYSLIRLGDGDRPFRVLTGPLDPEEHPGLVLQVGMYTRLHHKRMASLRKYLIIVLVFLILVATGGGWVLASRSLQPIDQLIADLSRVESRNLDDRLEVSSSTDEIDRLRRAINRMLERLNRAFDTLASFTADVAHELRTPLSTLQCRLDVALNKPRSAEDAREVLQDIHEQVAELAALVENLLLLARMDSRPDAWDFQPVDLAPLARDVAEPFALVAEEKHLTFLTEIEGQPQVEGEPLLLRRLLGNLLDNAVRYTPEGGRVTLRVEPQDGGGRITVRDTGVGIDPEALDSIFERFYRADESRSRDAGGAGLGLSICRRVVDLHGGLLDVRSTPGAGTTVVATLPPVPSSPLERPAADAES
jgi:two-component system heavy metal sensor histidine kinase CusS